MQGCLFMQDAGDFRKTENQDEVVQLSRLPPGGKIAEGLLEVNHRASPYAESTSFFHTDLTTQNTSFHVTVNDDKNRM